MSRSRNDLAYTEARSRRGAQAETRAGKTSSDSKAVQQAIEDAEREASQDYGRSFYPQGTKF